MKYEVAGDPVSGLRWTRKTTKKIAAELSALGIRVSRKTVAKLLKQMNFSLRTNKKKISNGSPPTRDAQFANITQLRERFSRRGNPILSVDTKKKELVGRFKNPGRVWAQKSDAVNDHDFRSMADGVAIPYGIYDLQSNRGTVYVGTSYDTSQFAVECIEKWWRSEGQKRFPGRKHLLVVADTGGSNGATRRAWKHGIQHKLCNEHGLDVTVAHYPPGASKWNPIEHRLFSEISKNWAGRPLDSYETILNFIRTTKTKTGLKVNARLVKKQYPKGIQNLGPCDGATQHQKILFPAEVELHVASIQEWEIISATVLWGKLQAMLPRPSPEMRREALRQAVHDNAATGVTTIFESHAALGRYRGRAGESRGARLGALRQYFGLSGGQRRHHGDGHDPAHEAHRLPAGGRRGG